MIQRLLFECVLRSSLIAIAAAGLLMLLRVKRASVQHLVWLSVSAWMILLPVCTVWLPKAPLRLLPAPSVPVIAFRSVPALPVQAGQDPRAGGSLPPNRLWNWDGILLLAIYGAGSGILAAKLAVGAARAHRLLRSAVNCGGYWTSSACAAPVTVGWLRPVVILPEGWRGWPAAQLAAVLDHEREHVRRRDPLARFVALLNRALFWFHPLAWWLERRLSDLAEQSCDDAVLESGHDRFEYSRWLLEIARTVERAGSRVNLLGVAMPGSGLPSRIRQIVSVGPSRRISKPRVVVLVAASLLVSTLFAAAVPARRRPLLVVAPLVEQARPESSSSQLAAGGRSLILFFDTTAMDPAELGRARAAAQRFIESRLRTGDRAAVLLRDRQIRVRQDYTEDRKTLLEAISQLPGAPAANNPNGILEGLRQVVRMAAAIEGKKFVIYFAKPVETGGEGLKSVIAEAVSANVAFYNVEVGPAPGQEQQQSAQQQPAAAPVFDAASIKSVGSAQDGGRKGGGSGGSPPGLPGVGSPDPNRVSGRNATLKQAIQFAYDLRPYQVAGPEWISRERYDIEARAASPATLDQLRQMLQALLAERFHLALHRESRVLPIYEMTVAKGGLKVREIQPGEIPAARQDVPGGCPCVVLAGTPAEFADIIVHLRGLEFPIVDKTGLSGRYQFNLHVEPDQDLVAPIEENLGLKLTAKKSPVDVLVIDRAEKTPVQN